jgi:L-fuconolactonase
MLCWFLSGERMLQRHHLRIDAHHHLWHYTDAEFAWIDDSLAPLRRDFTTEDLRAEMLAAAVSGSIAVQARQTLEETRWLLEQASQPGSMIRGVVGWLPLQADVAPLLDEFTGHSMLKGVRHIVQAEAEGFLDRPDFHAGIGELGRFDLAYDVLVYARQLKEATRFVDAFPNQRFVLDHIGKPDIRGGALDRWASDVADLARREHVFCKISGMVTEADFIRWTANDLKPYFDVALDAFGPQRLMVGSDWPVLTVATTYGTWWQTVEEWIAPLSDSERAAISGLTALDAYRIDGTGLQAEVLP